MDLDDRLRAAIAQGAFVVNVPGDDLMATAWAVGSDTVPPGVGRFEGNGLTLLPSEKVAPPRIAECRAHLECELDSTTEWGNEVVLFGRVVAFSMDEDIIGREPPAAYPALAPFFFLEGGWAAGLGSAQQAREPSPPKQVLTIFAVTDLARSVRFYRDAFGWKLRIEVPVFVEFGLPDGRGIGLYERDSFTINTGAPPASPQAGTTTATELYFHVDDLDAAIDRLEGAGARLLAARSVKPWGDEAAYYADPDGNVLVVARPVPSK